jgi:hypothetical protein
VKTRIAIAMVAVLGCVGISLWAQDARKAEDMEDCPMHNQHDASNHHAAMLEHGDKVMGFSHETTTHHFRLLAEGGTVEVTANDTNDEADVKAIRSHLAHITSAFAQGDFSAPMSVHNELPPGLTTMKLLQAKVRYQLEDMPAGARLSIRSEDPVAVAAIQDFLRYQIREHRTGDREMVPSH